MGASRWRSGRLVSLPDVALNRSVAGFLPPRRQRFEWRWGGCRSPLTASLSRPRFARFMADRPPCLVPMEACASAHHWARKMSRCGHEVRLIAPHYVKPFLKRQKNDAADSEVIVEAALRPTMRFVEPKSADQQALDALKARIAAMS